MNLFFSRCPRGDFPSVRDWPLSITLISARRARLSLPPLRRCRILTLGKRSRTVVPSECRRWESAIAQTTSQSQAAECCLWSSSWSGPWFGRRFGQISMSKLQRAPQLSILRSSATAFVSDLWAALLELSPSPFSGRNLEWGAYFCWRNHSSH